MNNQSDKARPETLNKPDSAGIGGGWEKYAIGKLTPAAASEGIERAEVEPSICRLQMPNGEVPEDIRECAEGWKQGYDDLFAKWSVIERAANQDNWSEFVTADIWRIIERIKSKCCRSLLQECSDKSHAIVELHEQIEGLRQRQPDLLEALKRLVANRHTHRATEGNLDKCAKCGKDIRSEVHYRVGESEATDREFALVAIAKAITQGEGTR